MAPNSERYKLEYVLQLAVLALWYEDKHKLEHVGSPASKNLRERTQVSRTRMRRGAEASLCSLRAVRAGARRWLYLYKRHRTEDDWKQYLTFLREAVDSSLKWSDPGRSKTTYVPRALDSVPKHRIPALLRVAAVRGQLKLPYHLRNKDMQDARKAGVKDRDIEDMMRLVENGG